MVENALAYVRPWIPCTARQERQRRMRAKPGDWSLVSGTHMVEGENPTLTKLSFDLQGLHPSLLERSLIVPVHVTGFN